MIIIIRVTPSESVVGGIFLVTSFDTSEMNT